MSMASFWCFSEFKIQRWERRRLTNSGTAHAWGDIPWNLNFFNWSAERKNKFLAEYVHLWNAFGLHKLFSLWSKKSLARISVFNQNKVQ